MSITHLKKFVAGWLLVITSMLLLAMPVPGAEQEFKTLELVRTYQSEEEFQAVNRKQLLQQKPIVDDGEFITFIDPETGQILKQMKKRPGFDDVALTDAERQQLADPATRTELKRHCFFYMLPHQGSPVFLLETEYELSFHPPNEHGESSEKELRTTVYNQQGKRILDLPPDTNLIAGALDGSHFVAYFDDLEVPGEYLYFYNVNGELLKKYPFRHGISIFTYSSNGEYLTICNVLGDEFSIFTKSGDIVFKGRIRDYAGHDTPPYRIFISDDGQYILLSTAKRVCLLNRNSVKQWELPSPPGVIMYYAYFVLDQGLLYLSPMIPDTWYNDSGFGVNELKILSVGIENGKILDEVSGIVYYTITNDILQIKKQEGSFYEYIIK